MKTITFKVTFDMNEKVDSNKLIDNYFELVRDIIKGEGLSNAKPEVSFIEKEDKCE